MASCYGSIKTKGDSSDTVATPLYGRLKNGRPVTIDRFRYEFMEDSHRLMNHIIEEGLTWPFEDTLDHEEFIAYFLSHDAFHVIATDQEEMLGMFYIKPNFPGRCSHICNGGFVTLPRYRGLGVGEIMAAAFLQFARQAGYKASYFNLVFRTNQASMKLWPKLGFKEIAIVPKAGRLKGHDVLIEASQFFYDLEAWETRAHAKSSLIIPQED